MLDWTIGVACVVVYEGGVEEGVWGNHHVG